MNKKDKEAFEKWFKKNSYDFYGYEKNNQKIGWQAACEYKQKKIDAIMAENAKLRECVEFYAETGNWTWSTSLLESSTLREIYDSDVSWTDTGGTYGEILSGGKRARQCLKELEK